jgi:hypothetical protein
MHFLSTERLFPQSSSFTETQYEKFNIELHTLDHLGTITNLLGLGNRLVKGSSIQYQTTILH